MRSTLPHLPRTPGLVAALAGSSGSCVVTDGCSCASEGAPLPWGELVVSWKTCSLSQIFAVCVDMPWGESLVHSETLWHIMALVSPNACSACALTSSTFAAEHLGKHYSSSLHCCGLRQRSSQQRLHLTFNSTNGVALAM